MVNYLSDFQFDIGSIILSQLFVAQFFANLYERFLIFFFITKETAEEKKQEIRYSIFIHQQIIRFMYDPLHRHF